MSIQDRMVRLAAATIVIAGLLLGGILGTVFMHAWLVDHSLSGKVSHAVAKADTALEPGARGGVLIFEKMEMIAPNAPSGQLFDEFDKIIVDVEQDGDILVFGEEMEVSKFRAMLLDQLTDHAKTIVTIRPDEDCLFRHIEQVIQVCDECQIHHQTITNRDDVAPAATMTQTKTS